MRYAFALASFGLWGCSQSAPEVLEDGAEALTRFLDAHPELIETVNEQGQRALHVAAEHDDVASAASLLDRHAQIDARDGGGSTALCVAARHDALGVATLLLARRADVEASCDSVGNRALHVAARYASAQTVRRLVSGGAQVDGQNGWGETALHAAALSADLRPEAAAAALVEAHASLEARDLRGFTPLHAAAAKNAVALVDVLVRAGAATTSRSVVGETPYELAHTRHQDAAASRLAEVTPDLSRLPPLFIAAKTDDLPRLLDLLPYVRRELRVDGSTALELAIRMHSTRCEAVLRAHAAGPFVELGP